MIIGLSPMDGITDAAFREITDSCGHPDLLFTEFVPVEAVAHGVTRVLPALKRHKTTTTTIAQFFGRDPKSFYKSAFVALELGYDGIDINMGCPDKNIAKKGGGAGLIAVPELAVLIIKTVKTAVADWVNGKTMEEARVPEETIEWIARNKLGTAERRTVPVSVKTRIGLDHPITAEWIQALASAHPAMISLHGRTLLQLYKGKADWTEIAIAAQIAKSSGIRFLGNGDIQTVKEASEHAKNYGCDGILIGRAALGNPWVFADRKPAVSEWKETILKHCRLFLHYRPDLKLYPMRKHLAWYMKGFPGSHRVRDELMHVVTVEDVTNILQSLPT